MLYMVNMSSKFSVRRALSISLLRVFAKNINQATCQNSVCYIRINEVIVNLLKLLYR